MPDVAMGMLSSADSVADQDDPSVWVARRVAVFGDFPCESVTIADETRPTTRLAKEVENPLKTRSFQGISSRGSGRSRTDDDGFAIPFSSPKPATEQTAWEQVVDGGSNDCDRRAAESAALLPQIRIADPDLVRLNELWPMLVSDDRSALLAHAEHLAALRGGATLERAACETSSR